MKIGTKSLTEALDNRYPGRGILIGKSCCGEYAVIAYFIMGRSENSRNRVFEEAGSGIRTKAFDPSKLTDPSLIIYSPVRTIGDKTIVTNGDQTDTIYDFLSWDGSFEEALRTRTFEPDMPNLTPRISGLVDLSDGGFSYKLSILKSENGNPESVQRFFYEYAEPVIGMGHLIHTYLEDGDPIPSFEGEPVAVAVNMEIDDFTDTLWKALDPENKVSLFVRYINLADKSCETRIINKHEEAK